MGKMLWCSVSSVGHGITVSWTMSGVSARKTRVSAARQCHGTVKLQILLVHVFVPGTAAAREVGLTQGLNHISG